MIYNKELLEKLFKMLKESFIDSIKLMSIFLGLYIILKMLVYLIYIYNTSIEVALFIFIFLICFICSILSRREL